MKLSKFTYFDFVSMNLSNSISINSRFQNFFTSIDLFFQNFRKFTFINDDILSSTKSIESSINQFVQKTKIKLKQNEITLFVRIVCQYKQLYFFHEKKRSIFYSIVIVNFNKKFDKIKIKNIVRTKFQKFAKNRKHELIIQKSDIAWNNISKYNIVIDEWIAYLN